MAPNSDHEGLPPSLSHPTQPCDRHSGLEHTSIDIPAPRNPLSNGTQLHFSTPNSLNFRVLSTPQSLDIPSRSGLDDPNKSSEDVLPRLFFINNDFSSRLPESDSLHRSDAESLHLPPSRVSQMVTPESSPLNGIIPERGDSESSLPGMHRSTPTTLAPAPIISPSSGRRVIQMLADNLSTTPDSPSPYYIPSRPEYMRRSKRFRTDSTGDREESAFVTRSDSITTSDNLGITVSPTKGRRLRLYEGQGIGINSLTSSQSSSRFEGTSLCDPPLNPYILPSSRPSTPEINAERLQRIERRLTAFSTPSPSMSQLFPAEVPGKGRVLINSATGLDLFVSLSPSRRFKKNGRGRRAIERPQSSPVPSLGDAERLHLAIAATTSWPDQEFPWSLHTQERLKRKDEMHKDRLARIRRFLEHDTDGEDEDESISISCVEHSHRLVDGLQHAVKETSAAPRRSNLNSRAFSFGDRMDSADAKEVLRASKLSSTLTKDTARGVSLCETNGLQEDDGQEEDDGVLNCICGTLEDRPMVRCDGCKIWYHQSCMGIEDEGDLDDEWYCFTCTLSVARAQRLREPTLVPTNEDLSISKANTHLPLYQVEDLVGAAITSTPRARANGNLQRSINLFQTPHAEYKSLAYQSQSSSSNPTTPYRFSNKSDIKVWATPSLFEDVATTGAPDSPFDPASTPSRGLKFGIPLISTATPRDFGAWAGRVSGLFTTPFHLGRSNQTNETGQRTLDFSDFTPGIPSWNNSPLALASSSVPKGQILEFGGDLVIAQDPSKSSSVDADQSVGNGLAPAAEIQVKETGK